MKNSSASKPHSPGLKRPASYPTLKIAFFNVLVIVPNSHARNTGLNPAWSKVSRTGGFTLVP